MKKVVAFLLIAVMCLSLTACGGKEKPEEDKSEEAESGDDGAGKTDEDSGKMYTLTTEDGQISIQVKKPKGFDAAEYASETCLNFERPGDSEGASAQYAMSLLDQDEESVSETMRQEVQYLISANSGDEEQNPEVQMLETGGKRWSYFSYSMEELEGYRVWTVLNNGCVFACTAENVGTGLKPLNIESIAAELSGLIQE